MNDFKVKDLRTRIITKPQDWREKKKKTTIREFRQQCRNLCYIYVNKNARTGEKKKTTRERERDHQLADCRVGCGFCVCSLSLSRVYVFVCFFVAALFRLKKRQKSKNFFQRFEIKINVVAREMGLSWPKRNGTPRSFLFGRYVFSRFGGRVFSFCAFAPLLVTWWGRSRRRWS